MKMLQAGIQNKYILPILSACIFFIINICLIMQGHFHEDAYILFIYVQNLVNGHGITFYPDGLPTEGATDFLWLILIAALVKAGINIGIATIGLNMIGVFIICYILKALIDPLKNNNKTLYYLTLPFMVIWLIQMPLIAALGGFSVFLYMALVLMGGVCLYNERYLQYTPWLSLIIGLFRPDGVIIGIGYTLIALYKLPKKQSLKRYLISCGLVFGLGLLYFIWRYDYFGHLLPLPLYVKSHGAAEGLNGLNKNFSWVAKNLIFIIPLIGLAVWLRKIKKLTILLFPVLLLFFALTIATQSQNIGMRFQAPILIMIYACLVGLIVTYSKINTHKFTKYILGIYVIILISISFKLVRKARIITDFNYINQLAFSLNKILPQEATIMLTEAGRLAYWNQRSGHKIIDIVGLNTPYPAKNTVNTSYIQAQNPALIMYHQANTLNIDWLGQAHGHFIYLNDMQLPKNLYQVNYTQKERVQLSKVKNAAVTATDFIIKERKNYDIFLVDYNQNKTYQHVYALDKRLNAKEKFEQLLTQSFNPDNRLSFYQMSQKQGLK